MDHISYKFTIMETAMQMTYPHVWKDDIISTYGQPTNLISNYGLRGDWTTLTRIQLAEILVRLLYDAHPTTSSTYWVAIQYLYKHMPASMLITTEVLLEIEEYTARGYVRSGLYNEKYTLSDILTDE